MCIGLCRVELEEKPLEAGTLFRERPQDGSLQGYLSTWFLKLFPTPAVSVV